MEGKADYQPPPGYEEKMHLIGTPQSPVWIGRKGDIPLLFTQQFWTVYEVWRRFNLGFGLPEAGPWTVQDQWLMDSVAALEDHYRQHFSPLRGLAELLVTIGKLIANRRRK